MKRYAEYKDSGIEWIGEIPQDWDVKKLGFVASAHNGDRGVNYPSGEDMVDEGIPFISTSELNDGEIDLSNVSYITEEKYKQLSGIKILKGDIIYCLRGSVGKSGLSDFSEGTIASSLMGIRSNSVNPRYLRYLLRSSLEEQQRNYLTTGSVSANLSAENVMRFIFAFPSQIEQNEIAIYLDKKTAAIDTLVSDKQKLIDLLKEKRQSIISEAVTKGLDKNAKMKDSGIEWISEIPDSWNMSKSQWLFSQRKERAYENDEQLTASQSLGIVYQKAYMEQENQRVVQVLKGADILKHVEENDFVISMRSFQGGIEWSGISGKISSAYVMLIPNYEYVNVQFFKWLFKSRAYITALQSTSNLIRDGQALRYDNFRQIDLPIIPLEEQEMIADYLNKQTVIIDQLIIDIQTQIEKLKEYRQSIISESVTGKTLIIEGQQPVAEKKATANLHFKRRVLAAHILDTLCDEPTMGHVKLEKLLFLSEHIAKLDLQTQYDRHAAGPYNPKVLRSIDTQLKKAEWFEYKATSETSNKYSKLPKSDEHETYYERYFDEQQRETVDKLMALFHSARTIQCEIVATLYGAWNDFIIDGIQPSDDKIVDEVLTNWHEKKERIARERWLGALKWMRDNQLIPDGYGTSTKGGRK